MVVFNHVKVGEREAVKLKRWYVYYHEQASVEIYTLKRLQRKHILLWSANAECAIAGNAARATMGPITLIMDGAVGTSYSLFS